MTRVKPVQRQHVAFRGRVRRTRIGAVGAAVALMLVATACGGSSGSTSSNGKVTLSRYLSRWLRPVGVTRLVQLAVAG